jgi:hypothetical protein
VKDMFNIKTKAFLGFLAFSIILIILINLNNLDTILYEPLATPESWLDSQPWIELHVFTLDLVIVQPTSTILVYSLGILALGIGISILADNQDQRSLEWWSYALLLWGLGALFAGTSYQIFSYEIKCAGRPYCLWTSWWEIYYMILTVGSVSAMMAAQAYACFEGRKREVVIITSGIIFGFYVTMSLLGSIIPIEFLISFELLVVFLIPIFIFLFIVNLWRYRRDKSRMDLSLIYIWISLGFIMFAYFIYLMMGITEVLWEIGVWFSENDVLHIGLIFWMLFIRRNIKRHLGDYQLIE